MRTLVETFVRTTNASDVDSALALFSPQAVIDDVSVGDEFACTEGVRLYLDRFFVGVQHAQQASVDRHPR